MEFFELISKNQKSFKTPYRIGRVLSDDQAMEAALFEGYKGFGLVGRNPLVGCSILSQERRLLSLGYHRAYGKEHAEIHAIKKVISSFSFVEMKLLAQFWDLCALKKDFHLLKKKKTEQIKKIEKILNRFSVFKNAHLFVTLEPCSFKGNQESCAKILSLMPFASVTYGILDPHSKVSGRGIKILKTSIKNVKPIQNLKLIQKIEELTEVFLQNIKNKRTFVALKIATSLDGKIALKSLASKKLKKSLIKKSSILSEKENIQFQKSNLVLKKNWITNRQARKYSHFLRGGFDATLVGINTLLVDNSRLDIRHDLFAEKKNKVVILDPKGKFFQIFQNLKLSSFHQPRDIFIVVGKNQFLRKKKTKHHLIQCPLIQSSSSDHHLDLDFLSRELFKRSIYSVYVEGGAGVHSSYFEQAQWNRIYQFLAPSLLGDLFSLSWTHHWGVKNINQRIQVKNLKVSFFGDNLLISGTS